MALGAVQFGLMYVLYIASFAWLPAWKVALLTIFTPLYVVAMTSLSQRRFRRRHLAAAALAVVGAAVVLWRSAHGPDSADWRGILLLQGANLCFAFGQTRFPRLQAGAGGRDAALVGWMYLGAFCATLLAGLILSAGSLPSLAAWDVSARWTLLYLGVLPTGVGFYWWNRGAARTTPGLLAVANNLKVPLAVLVSWLVFGEQAPYGQVLVGLTIVVAGLVVAAPRDLSVPQRRG